MVSWQYFPKSDKIPNNLTSIIKIFEKYENVIKSPDTNLKSNDVLSVLSQDIANLGYKVEKSKRKEDKINVPVLFGKNGKLEKSFEADAYHERLKTVIEVEAGRGVLNNQFLKDLFEACVMSDVDYLITAIRNIYLGKNDFNYVLNSYEALFASGRLKLPLKGVLIIGY